MNTRDLSAVLIAAASLLGACAQSSKIEPDIAMDPVATSVPNTYSFSVRGMACPNCAAHLTEEIEKVPGVKSASIDFAASRADVTIDPASPPASDAIREAGVSWMYEHMGLEYDPDCLDPANRERIRNGKAGG